MRKKTGARKGKTGQSTDLLPKQGEVLAKNSRSEKPPPTRDGQGGAEKDDASITLVVAAQSGDQSAFEELFTRNYPAVYAFARRILHDHHLAEDAAQKTFLIAWDKLHRLRDPRGFLSWLWKIVYREALRSRPRQYGIEFVANLHDAGSTRPFARLEQEEEVERAARALQALSARQRVMFDLRYRKHLSNKQIALFLGESEKNVRGIICKARKNLRTILGNE